MSASFLHVNNSAAVAIVPAEGGGGKSVNPHFVPISDLTAVIFPCDVQIAGIERCRGLEPLSFTLFSYETTAEIQFSVVVLSVEYEYIQHVL